MFNMIYKKEFHKTNPVSFSLFELVLFLILGILLNSIFVSIPFINDFPYLTGILVELILGLLSLILILRLGLFHKDLFSFKNLFLGFKLGFFIILSGFIQFIIYLYVNNGNSINIIWVSVFSSILYSFAVGFYEEVFMRGLILQNLVENYKTKSNGFYNAVFISAIVFGLAHLINILHAPLFDTLIQVVYSIAAGVIFGAVFIKTRNLLSIILLHGIFNLFTYLAVNLYSLNFISYNLVNYPLIYIFYNIFIIIGNFLIGLWILEK